MQLPIIDLSPLARGDLQQRKTVANAIGRACRESGFFYCTGHRLAESVLREVFEQSKRFFALPEATRLSVSREVVGNNRGYVAMGGEQLNPTLLPDRKETFNIGLELPPSDPEFGEPFRGANVWPDLPGWRVVMLSYYSACYQLGLKLHRAFSLDLGLPEEFFDDKLDRPMATLRLLHYPGVNVDEASDSLAPGAGSHTDYGNLTILAADGVAGLEVQRLDGTWLEAPSIAGAFICNIGDCLMRWSNDVYVSTPHRVRIPAAERYSIAFFLDPNPKATVIPVVSSSEIHARYAPITAAEYMRSRLDPAYACANATRE